MPSHIPTQKQLYVVCIVVCITVHMPSCKHGRYVQGVTRSLHSKPVQSGSHWHWNPPNVSIQELVLLHGASLQNLISSSQWMPEIRIKDFGIKLRKKCNAVLKAFNKDRPNQHDLQGRFSRTSWTSCLQVHLATTRILQLILGHCVDRPGIHKF